MLKYSLKPIGNLGLQEIQCYSMMVSPDLSYISGRTSNYNSIIDGENLNVVNNKNKFVNICKVKSENVKVQGKVKLDVTLPVKSITKEFIMDNGVLSSCTKNYVEYNGSFSYNFNGAYLVEGKLYAENDGKVTINTFAYIEDGLVKIGDKEYIADFRSSNNPNIMESKYAEPLNENDTVGNGIVYKGVSDYEPSKWRRETKFTIYRENDYKLSLDDALFGGYEHYIEYHGENYYLKELYDKNGNYDGYGVSINGKHYTTILRQIYDGEGVLEGDKMAGYNGSLIRISEEDLDIEEHPEVYYPINDSLVSPINSGEFIILVTSSQKLDIKIGDTIIAQSNGPISTKLEVIEDEKNGSKYVIYIGKKYDVIENAYKRIKVSDNYYRLIDESGDDYDAYAYFGSKKIYYKINNGKAIPINKIYYPTNDGVEYGILPEGYTIETKDGVAIGDNVYMVYSEEYDYEYIEIIEDLSYNFTVTEKNGSNFYICYPSIETESIYSDYDISDTRKYLCNRVIYNKDNFTFLIRNDIFGESQIYPETYLYDAVIAKKPFCTSEKLNLSIFKVNTYVNFKLPIVNSLENNLLRSDIIKSQFSKAISDRSRTSIVDMEKDVYYPVRKNGDVYESINCIRFNMHFRTRQLDNWKVIEEYVEDAENKEMTNWFITDYKFYKENINKTLHNSSDLIGYLNFTVSEAKNRAKKIGKSFLRLSFFSTNDPQTQTLLGTSTIFMDDALLCKKTVSFQKTAGAGKFIDTKLYQTEDTEDAYERESIGEYTELKGDDSETSYNFEKNSYSRLSSRIEVYNKHISNSSSEGFYFYMFKEFANNMRPLRIYLKIDFNHAGLGKTIPLIIPRKNMEDNIGQPLYVHESSDLKILKKGFKLKDIYKQLYLPIDVIFDDKNNRYVYYLPEQLRENGELGVDNDIMEFNLFEVKFKDESVVER